jgi:hypothetical protein
MELPPWCSYHGAPTMLLPWTEFAPTTKNHSNMTLTKPQTSAHVGSCKEQPVERRNSKKRYLQARNGHTLTPQGHQRTLY